MKNIMFISSSGDGGNYAFIDDLNRLDTFTGDYTPNQVKSCKELIEFAINNPTGSKSWRGMGFSNGEAWDENGYILINLLHDCFGFIDPTFTVEHIICCQVYM